MWEQGFPIEIAIIAAILAGVAVGLFNGFWVAVVGLPSLVVTLAGLIGIRGLAYILIEDRSIGNAETAFPVWFEQLGQQPLSHLIGVLGQVPVIGSLPFSMFLYVGLLVLAIVTLGMAELRAPDVRHRQQLPGRAVLGRACRRAQDRDHDDQRDRGGTRWRAVRRAPGAVRGSAATGFELDIITIVLLGGISIFGGWGTMFGVFLATVLVLNIRNGLGLLNVPDTPRPASSACCSSFRCSCPISTCAIGRRHAGNDSRSGGDRNPASVGSVGRPSARTRRITREDASRIVIVRRTMSQPRHGCRATTTEEGRRCVGPGLPSGWRYW